MYYAVHENVYYAICSVYIYVASHTLEYSHSSNTMLMYATLCNVHVPACLPLYTIYTPALVVSHATVVASDRML